MLTPDREPAATGRYETFVIRIWVNVEHVVAHGEIRHVASNRVGRFRDLEGALSFISGTIAGDAASDDRQGIEDAGQWT